ncbi:MAG: SRPBCC domain-containing protein [Hydrotalea sp.]|nr:SRPBCC domain-containing protein [Hydrotalea sp.]
MKKIIQKIIINAPCNNVWQAVVVKSNYNKWASAFKEGSSFEGDFVKGATIKFFSEQDNNNEPSYALKSTIAECKPNEFISIRHDEWAGAYENYSFKKITDQQTEFMLELDCLEDYYDMMNKMWGEALLKLKSVAEGL